jgi:hypothetical protein
MDFVRVEVAITGLLTGSWLLYDACVFFGGDLTTARAGPHAGQLGLLFVQIHRTG